MEDLTNLEKLLLRIATSMLFWFFIFAFVLSDSDPMCWHEAARVVYIITSLMSVVISYIMDNDN